MNTKYYDKIFIILLCVAFMITQTIGFIFVPKTIHAQETETYNSPFEVEYSPDGSLIAVTNATKGQLHIIHASEGTISRTVQLNGEPRGLAWCDNLIYVAEYGARTVAEVNSDNGEVIRRFNAGPKSVDVAVASGGQKLVVTDFGLNKVSIINLSTGSNVADVDVNNYPFFVESTTDGRYAIVGHMLPSGYANEPGLACTITFVDVENPGIIKNISLPRGSKNVRDVKVSPDGKWAYVAHTIGKTHLPTTHITKGWVSTNVVSIIDVEQQDIYTTFLLDRMMEGAADPWGLAISQDGSTLWVSIAGTHQVLKLDMQFLHYLMAGNGPSFSSDVARNMRFRSKASYDRPYSDVWLQIKDDPASLDILKYDLGALWGADIMEKIQLPGQGPRGISASPDGNSVAVGAYYTGEVYVLDAVTNDIDQTISLGEQAKEDSVRRGERIFHDGTLSQQGWLSCATCHPEGRSDGNNWDTPDDGIGNPKNTKSILGTMDTPPLLAHGVKPEGRFAIVTSFEHSLNALQPKEVYDDVQAYVEAMEPEISPYRNFDGTLTQDAIAGKALFESEETQCATCHYGPYYTDLNSYNVGTRNELDTSGSFDTPSLIELWRTAPYLHDGSAATIQEVLTTKNPKDLHGKTSHLTETEIDQLSAFILQLDKDTICTPTYLNIALDKPVVASNQAVGYTSNKANDGDYETYWTTEDAMLPHWWQVDLEDVYDISGIKVVSAPSRDYTEVLFQYVIEVSEDGESWSMIIDESGNQTPAPPNVPKESFHNTNTSARYVRITIVGTSGCGAPQIFEFEVFGDKNILPTAPTNLTALPISHSSIYLEWEPSLAFGSANHLVGYNIYANGSLVGWTSSTQTSYVLEGLSESTAYSLTITAIDTRLNESAVSNAVDVTTKAIDPPTSPLNLISSGNTDKMVFLSWEEATHDMGVERYNIYIDGVLAGWVSGTETTYTVTGLSGSTTYVFTVTAMDASGKESLPSNSLTITTDKTRIDAAHKKPALVSSYQDNNTADKANDSDISTQWRAESGALPQWWQVDLEAEFDIVGTQVVWEAAQDEDGAFFQYKIEVSKDANNWNLVVDQRSNQDYSEPLQKRIDEHSFNASARYVRITITGTSPNVLAGIHDFKVFAEVPPISAPKNLRAVGKTSSSIFLSWEPSTHITEILRYNIYSGDKLVGWTLGSNTSYTVIGLDNGTNYSFTVTASDAWGNESNPSNPASASTLLNIALNKPASASTTETNNVISSANDNDTNTRWCASSGGFPQWWQVDLEENYEIMGTQVNFEFDGRTYNYVIEVSDDGSNWTRVVDETNNAETTQVQSHNFTSSGRYVRITFVGASSGTWASIREFEVFASQEVPAPLFPLEVTKTSINKIGGIQAEATVNAYEASNAVVIFKLIDGLVPVGLVAIEDDISEVETFSALFPGHSGDDFSVRIFVWDKLDNSADYMGIDLAEPVTIE